jgi:cell division protein FtsI (penicillin-binding protein 3)
MAKVSKSGKKKSSQKELRIKRRVPILTMLTLPLLLALYGFFDLQRNQPSWPERIAEVVPRGSIMTRDGTMLAEGSVVPSLARRYPQGKLAAHVVGFSGKLQDQGNYGLEGLEYTQDARLQAGQSITVTLDPRFQASAQLHLRKMVEGVGAENGSVVAIEAGTGRLLAVASYPEYDPNQQAQLPDRDVVINKAFLNQYEPGSVMKPFVVAALLESQKLSLDELIATPLSLRVGDKTFQDVVEHDLIMTIWNVLRYSSNSGMIQLSEKFTDDELRAWLSHFGFGREVGMPSLFTRTGQILDTPWVPQDHASVTIGQSLSTTTLQLAAAYSIFANDGLYLTPYIIEGDKVPSARPIVSAETAQTMRALLAYVVAKGSTHNSMAPGVSVAGKTGTADIFDKATGSYLEGDYTVTFAGIFPAENPKVTMVVSVQKPRTKTSSTEVAAPLFGNIQKEIIALWGMPNNPNIYAEAQ